MKHITIITGGESDERVISLQSAKGVHDVLVEKGYDVTQYCFPEEMRQFVAESTQYDFVRVMVHGV